MEAEPGESTTEIHYPEVSASDNCSVDITQLQGLGSGACFPTGTTKEVYLATDPSGNTDTLVFTITVNAANDPTAVAPEISPGTIRIYPNPTNGWLRLEMDDYQRFTNPEIEIYSVGGEKILQREMKASSLQIDVRRYKDGLYFLRVKAQGLDVTKRFIVTRHTTFSPD